MGNGASAQVKQTVSAQQAVAKLPDLQERPAQALTARNSQTRAVAAEWMGRLGDRRAAGPLHAAAKREKQDAALDEMLTALEKLGEPIEPYLDRDKLKAEAEKGLKKGTPPALAWFPWAALPSVHWQDTGVGVPALAGKGKRENRQEEPPKGGNPAVDAVPTETITWLLVQHYKLKSPEAGPLLRRYCAMMCAEDREELGRFVLGAWLDQDLKRKYTDVEARAKAKQQAPQSWQTQQQALQWYQTQGKTPPSGFSLTLQQIEDRMFRELQRECGSAVAEKGILAVAGACCGDSAVAPVQKYLKDWYGYRAAQCKAAHCDALVDRPASRDPVRALHRQPLSHQGDSRRGREAGPGAGGTKGLDSR